MANEKESAKKAKAYEAKFVEVKDEKASAKKDEKSNTKEKNISAEETATLQVFTVPVMKPVESEYLELSERYVAVRDELNELVESVKDVVVTEEYLVEATAIQRKVNALWNEIEDKRKEYHKYVDSIFYDPIAEKIEKEIKIVYQEWENTFKAEKTRVENQLLENRVNEVSAWFSETAKESGLEWLTLNDALNQKAVKITRKNKAADIVKSANAFIEKVKDDIAVLRDGYGDEEIAEYRKTFNAASAIATVRARNEEIEKAKQVQFTPEAPLVQEVVEPQAPQAQADGKMTRVWELTGTREQLVALAKTAIKLGVEYRVLGGK